MCLLSFCFRAGRGGVFFIFSRGFVTFFSGLVSVSRTFHFLTFGVGNREEKQNKKAGAGIYFNDWGDIFDYFCHVYKRR